MEGHQLHLIQLFIRFAALHHVAQRKAGDHLRQGHRLIDFAAFQHLGHPGEQLVDVFHAHFRGFRAGRGFIQPGFVINPADQVAHGVDRLAFGQLLDLAQPVGEAGE